MLGSIRASIFSLVATALGTGVLALPFLLRLTGLVLGLGFLTLGATLCLISLYMLSYCSFKKQETQYSVLVEKVLGNVKNYGFPRSEFKFYILDSS